LIAKPDVRVSTKYVYTHLKLDESTAHPDIDGQIDAIRRGDLKEMCSLCGNVLETVTEQAYPVISDIKKRMKEHGALAAMMSGSGPSVFGIFEKREDARKAASVLREDGYARMLCVTEPFYAGNGRIQREEV
jgi:4-diphosphocytidyl-2-C-methyl-D-erythritol kinase